MGHVELIPTVTLRSKDGKDKAVVAAAEAQQLLQSERYRGYSISDTTEKIEVESKKKKTDAE